MLKTLPPLVLASKSPRRHELLRAVGLPFRVIVREGLETYPDELAGAEIAAYLAERKAEAYEDLSKENLILTADTIVWQNRQVLGKPADRKDAIRILTSLSGSTHEVITGVCLFHQEIKIVFTETTHVTFSPISKERIEWYVDNFPIMDKAGAYGVQDWIGLAGVSRIEGDFYTVMGLPVNRLIRELENLFLINFEIPE
jgi:septum formation protein